MTTDSITTRTARVWLRADGVIQLVTLPGIQEGLEDAKENIAAIAGFASEKKRPVLVGIPGIKGIDREARIYYSSQEATRMMNALALLVDSPVSRVLANFFIGLYKPPVPTKLFTSEEEAVAWLKNFIELTERETGESRWREDKK